MPAAELRPPHILILTDTGDRDTPGDAVVIRQALSSRGYVAVVAYDEFEVAAAINMHDWDIFIAGSLLYWGSKRLFRHPPKGVKRLALSANSALYDSRAKNAPEAFLRKPFQLDQVILIVDAFLGRA